MEDIELIIKIDEELYNYIQTEEYDEHLDKRFDYQIRFAVKDGTPLPKGHGRLIDVDDLVKRAKQFADSPNNYISQRNKDFIYILEREEIIIPADKAESEE